MHFKEQQRTKETTHYNDNRSLSKTYFFIVNYLMAYGLKSKSDEDETEA